MPKIEIEVTEQELRKMKCNKIDSPVKIVILQRGWVFIGRFKKTNSDCILENAQCIRQWGTTRGIGELVNGPTSSTKLDECGKVSFNEMTIVALIDCEESKWEKYC
jgi:hypothetical protein